MDNSNNTDPVRILKAQIGELVWANAVLLGQIEQLKKELKEKNNESDVPGSD